MYSERSGGTEFNNFVAAAIRNDQVPPLASLRTYSGTPRETLRNYGLGHAVVSYMIDTYGEAKMSELFATLRTSHGFEKAVEDAYGLTVPELDNQWRQSVGLAPLDLATPPLPPLQVLPTRRPTPTSAPPPAQTDAVAAAPPTVVPPAATPAGQVEPTYTPRPSPTDVPAPMIHGIRSPCFTRRVRRSGDRERSREGSRRNRVNSATRRSGGVDRLGRGASEAGLAANPCGYVEGGLRYACHHLPKKERNCNARSLVRGKRRCIGLAGGAKCPILNPVLARCAFGW